MTKLRTALSNKQLKVEGKRNRGKASEPRKIGVETKLKAPKEDWGGISPDVGELDQHASLATRKAADGRVTKAAREHVGQRLFAYKAVGKKEVAAFEMFCEDWAVWKGMGGSLGGTGKVDGGQGCKEILTDRMIKARGRVKSDLNAVGPHSRGLLARFCIAHVEQDRGTDWRGIVEAVTGETRDREQRAHAVYALEELAMVRLGGEKIAA